MLIDHTMFDHPATVPWPGLGGSQLDWVSGVQEIELWLQCNVGSHYTTWHWSDSGASHLIGVNFKWDQDRTLFVLVWSG